MKVTNFVLSLAAVAGFAASLTASDTPATTAPTTTTAATTTTAPAASLSKLAGEWDGTVEIRWNDKESSSSIASVSARMTQDGSLLACFEGYAKGERFEGSMRMRAEADRAMSVSYDTRTGATSTAEGPLGEVANVFTMTGEADHPLLMKKVNVRQVARIVSDSECVIEWLVVEKDGKETPKMRLNLVRMKEGELSIASALFENKKLVGRVDSALLPTMASADDK